MAIEIGNGNGYHGNGSNAWAGMFTQRQHCAAKTAAISTTSRPQQLKNNYMLIARQWAMAMDHHGQ